MKSRFVLSVILFTSIAAMVFSEPTLENESSVVVTTPWTAAFAQAAGVDGVHVLAPYEMTHPSEYELKPSDIPIVQNAEAIIYAGYERTVAKIREAAGAEKTELIQIVTTYSLSDIKTSVRAIAERIGSVEKAETAISEIETLLTRLHDEAAGTPLAEKPVVVHVFQVPLAKELGISIAGTFGPAPLEARQIESLTKTGAFLIIDNAHNPIAAPLRETLKQAAYVQLINFPGTENTRTLTDVITLNGERIRSVLRP